MTSRQEHFINAAASLGLAYTLIDRLGEFFQVEHTWVSGEDWVDYEWPEKVNTRVDHLGFVVPELYEALIHLAHAMENALRGWSEPEEPELPEEPVVP